MADESSEMSLDDVLSSIKQMVIDKEPPVLELTDMLSSDGKIVSVKSEGVTPTSSSDESGDSDMKTFLQLAQSNSESEVPSQENPRPKSPSSEKFDKGSMKNSISEIVTDITTTLVRSWLNEHLEDIVRDVVKQEVKNLIVK